MEDFKNTEDFQQISDDEITKNDVEGSGNPLKGSVADNQAIFDRLPKLIAGKVNALIGVVNNIKNFFIAHLNDGKNPHNVTKEQVGLPNVDNTSDVDKPVSNAVKEELNNKADKTVVQNSFAGIEVELGNKAPHAAYLELYNETHEHFNNTQNPHNVTKEQVGLSNVDNTSDVDKPVSKAVKEELELLKDILELKESVDEVDRKDMWVYGLLKAELDKKEDAGALSELLRHKADCENPHNVTKEQVGLNNVDNTSDMDKPVSTAVMKLLPKGVATSNTRLISLPCAQPDAYLLNFELSGAEGGVGDYNQSKGKYNIPLKLTGKSLIDYRNSFKFIKMPDGYNRYTMELHNLLPKGNTFTVSFGVKDSATLPTYFYFNSDDPNAPKGALDQTTGKKSDTVNLTTDKEVIRKQLTFTVREGYEYRIYYALKNMTDSKFETWINKFSYIQVETGNASPYEAYTEKEVNIVLDAPIKSGEVVDIGSKVKPLESAVCNITVNSTVAPVQISSKYIQSINALYEDLSYKISEVTALTLES